MININEVINIYNQFDINVLDGSALREDLFLKDIIFSFIKSNYLDKNPKSYFPKSRSMIPNFYSPFTKDKVSDWRKSQKVILLNLYTV
ncbi:MAG: hypothetical protein P8Y97_07890 [Candidatus Lokiarchaeota archaeon]